MLKRDVNNCFLWLDGTYSHVLSDGHQSVLISAVNAGSGGSESSLSLWRGDMVGLSSIEESVSWAAFFKGLCLCKSRRLSKEMHLGILSRYNHGVLFRDRVAVADR